MSKAVRQSVKCQVVYNALMQSGIYMLEHYGKT
jgi:hypothetical protein